LIVAEARHPRIPLQPSLPDQYNYGATVCESFFDDFPKIRSGPYGIHVEEHLVAESGLELIDQPPGMTRRIGAEVADEDSNLFARAKQRFRNQSFKLCRLNQNPYARFPGALSTVIVFSNELQMRGRSRKTFLDRKLPTARMSLTTPK
jgi:hypothetical protein